MRNCEDIIPFEGMRYLLLGRRQCPGLRLEACRPHLLGGRHPGPGSHAGLSQDSRTRSQYCGLKVLSEDIGSPIPGALMQDLRKI